jgi:succinate dehydrogenase / fumarate reductase, cytochrome b subunit
MTVVVAPDDTPRTSPVVADRIARHIEPRSFVATQVRTVLALTGFVMLGFVVIHLAGNLLAFAGSGAFNAYARSLREIGTPVVGEGALLWAGRGLLTVALVLHLAAHAYLQLESTSPRPEYPSGRGELWSDSAQYFPMPPWYATLPVGWLQATGGCIAVFAAFHIAQLTIGVTQPAFVPSDPYHNMVAALGFWPVSIAYVAAALAVGAHVLPGIWTGMRSLGLIRPNTEALAGTLSVLTASVLVAGLAAVPCAVLIGLLR